MADSGAGPLGHSRAIGAAGILAVVLLAAGVPMQAAFTARTAAHRLLTAEHGHDIRNLMLAASDHIPEGARYAVTSRARTPNAVYTIRQAKVVVLDLTGSPAAVHRRLERAGVGFVIVLYRNRPRAFAPPDLRLFHRLASVRAGQVLQVADG